MNNKFDSDITQKLMRRLLQLAAANNLGVFSPEGSPPLRCKPVDGCSNLFKVSVYKDLHLLFSHSANVDDENVWTNIKEIRIEKIKELVG
tara:strand:- start:23051 stop:23320 length:270 start_codon:yes stop_codon:yes gene_type:complete